MGQDIFFRKFHLFSNSSLYSSAVLPLLSSISITQTPEVSPVTNIGFLVLYPIPPSIGAICPAQCRFAPNDSSLAIRLLIPGSIDSIRGHWCPWRQCTFRLIPIERHRKLTLWTVHRHSHRDWIHLRNSQCGDPQSRILAIFQKSIDSIPGHQSRCWWRQMHWHWDNRTSSINRKSSWRGGCFWGHVLFEGHAQIEVIVSGSFRLSGMQCLDA